MMRSRWREELCRGMHHLQLLSVQRRVAKHLEDRQYPVQRRPDLVAHGRQEFRLGAARLLGEIEYLGQLGLECLPLFLGRRRSASACL